MIKLSKEKVLLLHQLIVEKTGGSVGVRDVGLLESALSVIMILWKLYIALRKLVVIMTGFFFVI